MPLKIRDYAKLLNRLKLALSSGSEIKTIGNINNINDFYQFQKIHIGRNNPKRVLISAGIHGDEPAGVETVCVFLESEKYKLYLKKWDFVILPCINPHGYEYNIRENQNNIDLNRMFKVDLPPIEVKLAQSIFNTLHFNLTLELHEDCDTDGYYLFQKSNKPFGVQLGYKIIESVKDIMSINLSKKIDGIPAEKGLIHRIKNIDEMEWWPMASYSLAMNSEHCFTLETPSKLPMHTRVKAHLQAIDKALVEYPE